MVRVIIISEAYRVPVKTMANSDWLDSGHMATSEPITVAEGCDSPTNQLRVTVNQEICWGGFRLGVRSRLPHSHPPSLPGPGAEGPRCSLPPIDLPEEAWCHRAWWLAWRSGGMV